MTQDTQGNGNRIAGRNYNENSIFIQFGDDEYPIISNLPKKTPYELEFVGRKAEIEEIIQIIDGGKGGYKLSIEGIGGLGKTTLAYEACRVMIDSGKAKHALWFTCKMEDFNEKVEEFSGNFCDTKSFLIEAISLLGYKGDIHEISVEELKKIFKQLIGRQAKEKILFVLDNLETVKDPSFFELIKEMQHFPGDFYLIITSRNNLFIYNENCIVLRPIGNSEMISIIENFRKSFKIPKLLLDISVILNFCGGNPLIARIIVQKMKYMNGDKIYHDYIKNEPNKGEEILDYIFKNTYDSLSQSTQYFLLLISHFDYIEDFLLREIEKIIRESVDVSFSIESCLGNELRKTFFVKFSVSSTSIFGVEELGLEDFVEEFLNSKQTDRSTQLYASLNIEIQKLKQRVGRYEQLARDFGAKSQIDSMVIVDVIDKETELKNKKRSAENTLDYLKGIEGTYPNVPYVSLLISKIYKNYYTDKLSEAITYGEKALKKARVSLGNSENLKHYIYPLRGLYIHAKLYDQSYELNKQLENLGVADYEDFASMMRHELNIDQIDMAFESGTKGWALIVSTLQQEIINDKFRISTFIISYYKSAVMTGNIEIMRVLKQVINAHSIKFQDDYTDIDLQFNEMEEYCNTQGAYRLKIRQMIQRNKRRIEKGFLQKDDYIKFLNSELEKDNQNGMLYYELYRYTGNPDFIFDAFKYMKNDAKIIDCICRELIKHSGERIGELLDYALKGIALKPDSVNFYGYKGLYYLNKKLFDDAISAFEKGIENFEKLPLSQQESTQNKYHLEEINKHYDVARKRKLTN